VLVITSQQHTPGLVVEWRQFTHIKSPVCTLPSCTVLARDPQSVIFYDSKGQFVGVRRPGSGKPIQVRLQARWLSTLCLNW
jgi:hypothetical protein